MPSNPGDPPSTTVLQFNNTRGNGVDVKVALNGGAPPAQPTHASKSATKEIPVPMFNTISIEIFKTGGNNPKGTMNLNLPVSTTADRAVLVLGPASSVTQDCALIAYSGTSQVGASSCQVESTG